MNYIVDPETVELTTCEKDFLCLYGDKTQLCKVEFKIGERHYMSCQHNESCRHQESRPGLTQCSCPVRIEIYKHYGQ